MMIKNNSLAFLNKKVYTSLHETYIFTITVAGDIGRSKGNIF